MLIVGTILCTMCFVYIKDHPGEWNSFIPSLQMLYYKGQVFVYKSLGYDTRNLELKQQFTKIYTELSYLVQSSNCTDPTLLEKIKSQQEILKNIDISQLQIEQYSTITTAQELKQTIEEQCAYKGTSTPQ